MRGSLRSDRRNSAGFSLLELSFALAIFSIGMVAFYGSFSKTASLRNDAVAQTRTVVSARTIIGRLENDISAAADTGWTSSLIPLLVAPSPEDAPIGQSLRLILDLTTFSAAGVTAPEALWSLPDGPVDRADQARVRWLISPQGELFRSESRPPAPLEDEYNSLNLTEASLKLGKQPLRRVARGVLSIELRFFDGKTWTTSWDSYSASTPTSKLPLMVETHLVIDNGEDRPIELVSTTPIAMAAPGL